ncbi:MAG: hypothetical protein M5U08_21805 [Burkholderiales bacterium]|nr:hypothetical protein [Burkholderiales bacterium]
MMVRVRVRPAALPAACSKRPSTTSPAVGASPARALPKQKSAVPARITGRRPNRSESGPYTSVMAAMVRNERLISVCAAAIGMSRSRCTNGTAGVRICVAIGPSP